MMPRNQGPIKVRVIGYTSTGKTYHFGPPTGPIPNENIAGNADVCRGVLYRTTFARHNNPLGRLRQQQGGLAAGIIYYDIVLDEGGGCRPNTMTISLIPIKYNIPATPFNIEIAYYDYPGQDHLLAYILLFNLINELYNNNGNIGNYKQEIRALVEKLSKLASYNPQNDSNYNDLINILKDLLNTIIINGRLNQLVDMLIGYNATGIRDIIFSRLYDVANGVIAEDYNEILDEDGIKTIYINTFKNLQENIEEFRRWGGHPLYSSTVIARLIFTLLSHFYREFIKYICERIRQNNNLIKFNGQYCELDNCRNQEKKEVWAELFAVMDVLSYIFEKISTRIRQNVHQNITITINNINDWVQEYIDSHIRPGQQVEGYFKYSMQVEEVVTAIDSPTVVVARLAISVLFTILAILSAIVESDVLFLTVPANTKKFLLEHLGPKHGLYPGEGEQMFETIIEYTLEPIMASSHAIIGENIEGSLVGYCQMIFEDIINVNNVNCEQDRRCGYACVKLLKSSIIAISIFNYYILKLIRDLRQDNMPVVVVIATMLDTVKYPNRENLSEEEEKQRDAMMRKAVLCSMATLTNYIVRMGGGNIQNFQELENIIKSCWKSTMVAGPWLFRFIPPFLPSIHMHAGAMEEPVIIITPGGAIIVNGEGCINGTFAVVASTALFSAVEPGLRELVVNLERSLYCNYTNYEEEGCD